MSLRLLAFFLVLIASNFALANSVFSGAHTDVTSAWQSPYLRVSLSSKDWIVTHPAPDRLLLEHRSHHTSVLIVEYGSSLSKFEASLYLRRDFVRDAKRNRSTVLSLDTSNIQDVVASVAQFDGQIYGATQMILPTPRGEVSLAERIWVEDGRAWQVSIAEDRTAYSNSTSTNRILDDVMADVMQRSTRTASIARTTRFIASDGDEAEEMGSRSIASETIRPTTSPAAPTGSPSDADRRSWYSIPTEKECAAAPVSDDKRGTSPFGLKFQNGSIRSCMSGGEDAIKKWAGGIKQAFISGMESVSQHAEENLRQNPCAMPAQPSGIIQWMGYSSEMEEYNACLSSAGTTAVIQSGRDLVVSTAKGIGALINYVRSIDDPVALVTAILQKETTGFMCMSADAQAQVMCEFITHAAGAIIGTALTSGAGAAIAAGGDVALAARGALAMKAGLDAAKAMMLSPITVPVAAVRVAVTAPVVAARIATESVRGIAGRIAAAQAIRIAAKTEFSDILTRLASSDGNLDALKRSLATEKNLTGDELRVMNGQVDAASKKLKEIQEAYSPFLAKEKGEKAATITLISKAEEMGFSRAKIEGALKDGLQCK